MHTTTTTPHAHQPASETVGLRSAGCQPADATQSRQVSQASKPASLEFGFWGFGISLGFGILGFGISNAAPAPALTPTPAPANPTHPNVLIILGDDIGWGDISLHGGKTPTPRIDALATQSVELTNFMVSPLCSPSRSMLLTARHYLRTNQGPVTDGSLDPAELTIAKTFRAAGYGTAIFGKWHNSYDPQTPEFKAYLAKLGVKSRQKPICVLEYGFDTSWNYYGGGADYYTRRTIEGFVSWWNGYVHRPDDQGWTDDMITDHAIDYLKQHAANATRSGSSPIQNPKSKIQNPQPFFAYVACELLHAPYQPKWEDYQQVPDALIPKSGRLTHEQFDRYARKDNAQARDWPAEHLPSAYAALVVAHNRNVGRLLDALDTLGLADNTIVVYFTDNGATPQGSNLPFRGGKHTTWEGGVHVPCMIRWPGHIPPATKWPGLAGAMELMPTLAAMANIPLPASCEPANDAPSLPGNARVPRAPSGVSPDTPPFDSIDHIDHIAPLDGKNIWPALQHNAPSPVQNYYWTMDNEDALRTAQWKARRSVDGVELYDIVNDIGETRDISAAHPDIVKNLTAQMDAWIASTGAQITHLPTKTPVGPAAPSGQILKISVTLNRDIKRPPDYLLVPFASWTGDHRSQDLLVVDVMVPRGAQPSGYRLTPLDLAAGGNGFMFTNKTGVDQYNRLAWDGAMPAAGYGQWERRAYGLSRDTPHPLKTIAMLLGGKKGRYTIYIDNLFIQHSDGTRTILWQDAANTYDKEKSLRSPVGYKSYPKTPRQLTALPDGFTDLKIETVDLKDATGAE